MSERIWIDSKNKYQGMWLALKKTNHNTEKDIINFGSIAIEVFDKAENQGFNEPTMFFVKGPAMTFINH